MKTPPFTPSVSDPINKHVPIGSVSHRRLPHERNYRVRWSKSAGYQVIDRRTNAPVTEPCADYEKALMLCERYETRIYGRSFTREVSQ